MTASLYRVWKNIYTHVPRSLLQALTDMWKLSFAPVVRAALTVILMLTGVIVLVLMYYKSPPPPKCPPPVAPPWWRVKQNHFHSTAEAGKSENSTEAMTQKKERPILLLWLWPENRRFDLKVCETNFQIDGCNLTDDKTLFSRARGVLFFHRAIQDDLSNLPTLPRPRFQRWIWMNMDSPTNTRKVAGIEGLFNLTLNYRKDSDIQAHWPLTFRKNTDEDFLLPKKERLLCWIVDRNGLQTKSSESYSYYRELVKHIQVDVFYSAELSNTQDYFQTISRCKFYLSFENSIHRDYITETFNAPLAAGTVPVVLGPPRRNYEDFAPGTSFIHVKDFSNASKLAEFLLKLDRDVNAYMRYFHWRRFYTARRHPVEEIHEFAHAICQACHHLSINKAYRLVPDVYKWFFA